MNVVPMTPITNLRLCSNVPLDNRYTDTLDFSSVSAQAAYFSSKAVRTYNNFGPITMQNKIRVPLNADAIYNCNYIMFNNANFGSKWFYAFITGIEYKNVNLSLVSFELDVLQTWMFDYQLKECYVERETVLDDRIGSNLVGDNLNIGEYVANETPVRSGHMNDFTILIASSTNESGQPILGDNYAGVYSGLHYYMCSTADIANNVINSIVNSVGPDAIIGITMMPSDFNVAPNSSPAYYEIDLQNVTSSSGIAGYTPENNKLYTAPYNFLYVNNLCGQEAIYPYEYFTNGVTFGMTGEMTLSPSVSVWPKFYKSYFNNYVEKMTIDSFPQCSWATDSYKAWLAQNAGSRFITAAASVTSLAAGVATGNPLAAIGGASALANFTAKEYDIKSKPPNFGGSNGANNMFARRVLDFYFTRVTITPETARRIDSYWKAFGYPLREVKKPVISGRPRFNYIETREAVLTGNIPFGDMRKIGEIYDSGLRIWHGDWIGDFTTPNPAPNR